MFLQLIDISSKPRYCKQGNLHSIFLNADTRHLQCLVIDAWCSTVASDSPRSTERTLSRLKTLLIIPHRKPHRSYCCKYEYQSWRQIGKICKSWCKVSVKIVWLYVCQQILANIPNTKFEENPYCGSCSVHVEGQTDRQDEVGVAFRTCFANTLKKDGKRKWCIAM
jgi:hypothetical protein